MSSHKNQHFVPKVHMVPFSADPEGNSINLFNIKRRAVIAGAGIKHQCSGSYYYGEDGELERVFGQIEGRYAEIVRHVEDNTLSDDDRDWMAMFMVLQYSRTRRAAERRREFLEKAAAVTLRGRKVEDKPDTSPRSLVFGALSEMKSRYPFTLDLKFGVIRNRSSMDFVTSDSPVIFTNRFYLQQLRRQDFGAANAGALYVLPVGKRFAVSLYDSGIYSVDQSRGFIEIRKDSDVVALNSFQYLTAFENIYFANRDDGARIAAEFASVSDLRPREFMRFIEMKVAEKNRFGTKYESIRTQAEADTIREKLILSQSVVPCPSRWPSPFSFRSKKTAYTNGSAMGIVRKAEWLRGVRPQ